MTVAGGLAHNRWTLAFRDRVLERAYRDDSADAMLKRFRVVTGVLIVVMFLLNFVDAHTGGSPANVALSRLLRFGLALPATVLALAFGFAPRRWIRPGLQPVVTALAGLFMFANFLVGLLLPDRALFDIRIGLVSLAVFSIGTCTVVGLRFVGAAVATIPANIALLTLIVVYWPEIAPPAVFWIGLGNALGLFTAYQLEKRDRAAFALTRQLAAERERSEDLLRNVLPESIKERLKAGDRRIADKFADATVLFADIVGFTARSQDMPPETLVSALDDLFSAFDDLADRFGLEKIKTIGDAYMVVGGVPVASADHPTRVANMALEMLACVQTRKLEVRIGIHTGPLVAGVIGKRKFIYDLWGDAVNTASRMESHGVPGEIQVSAETYQRLASGFRLEPRGVVPIKGKGEMETWLLRGRLAAT